MSTPTVYLVDDDDDMRDSLACLLQASGYLVRAYPSALDFLNTYRIELEGCLVVDQQMPGMKGLELIERLHSSDDEAIPTIFITAYADVPTAVSALKGGAIDFLEKPFDRERLLEQVDKAFAQDRIRHTRRLRSAELACKFDRLSDREKETIALLQEGLPNKVIAQRLDITERAVEMRRSKIMHKLEVHSIAELLAHKIEFEYLQIKPERHF